mgnify:CR=1 FL=1
MSKLLTNVLLLLLVFGAGLFVSQYLNFSFSKTVEKEESIILLERIKTVSKLVTVEGYFSESYTHKEWDNYMGVDFNFGPFRKKARLRVTAKVLIGFDLEKMTFQTHPEEKLLIISHLPEPEILSVEPDIVYEELYEGYLNYYTKEDRTKLNKMAKDYINKKALENKSLKDAAIKQGYETLKLIELIVKDTGWEVKYSDEPTIPPMIRDSIKIKD